MIKWEKPHKISIALYILYFIVGFTVSTTAHRAISQQASIPPETPVIIQCDADTIIHAHYAEVIDAMREQRHFFNPAYDVPKRKPKR